MLSPKRIKLMLAIALIISTITVLGVTFDMGRTASANPSKGKLLRRHDKAKDKPNVAEEALLRKQVGQQDVPKDERKLKTREFKDLPLKVQKMKNLQSDTWHKDLEIEIRNTGTKPIYSIVAYLEFPDDKIEANGVSGIHLIFGERRYIDIRTIGDPQHPHLNPGDTYIFTIPEQYRKGLKVKHERSPEAFKKLELYFAVISFGDGTGFDAEQPADYRKVRQSSAGGNRNHHASRFLGRGTRSPPQDGCGSCARYIQSTQTVPRCYDARLERPCDSLTVTTASWASCKIEHAVYFDCNGDGVNECHDDVPYSSNICPGYSPTPTPSPSVSPSPSPEPTCNQATKPNTTNCFCSTILVSIGGDPIWSCYCSAGEGADYFHYPGTQGYAGCPSNKYNNQSDCCVCIQQTCPGGGVPNKYTCECPTPTPILGGGGGGGGGEENGGNPYDPGCTNYYWVWFYSYDGGETWVVGEIAAWAGCW